MKYDPNWLQKERAKTFARQERELSHIEDKNKERHGHYTTMLCGKGWGAKGHPSIRVVRYPDIDNLPTCRPCREKWLNFMGYEVDPETGYPK